METVAKEKKREGEIGHREMIKETEKETQEEIEKKIEREEKEIKRQTSTEANRQSPIHTERQGRRNKR